MSPPSCREEKNLEKDKSSESQGEEQHKYPITDASNITDSTTSGKDKPKESSKKAHPPTQDKKIKALDMDLPSFQRLSCTRQPELSEKEVSSFGGGSPRVKSMVENKESSRDIVICAPKESGSKDSNYRKAPLPTYFITVMLGFNSAFASHEDQIANSHSREINSLQGRIADMEKEVREHKIIEEKNCCQRGNQIMDVSEKLKGKNMYLRLEKSSEPSGETEKKIAQKVAKVSALKPVSLEFAHLLVDTPPEQEKEAATLPKEELVIGDSWTNRITLNGHEIVAM
ncbi:hypothetical protein ISN44_As13g000380 [Arabidopsis suecica]|uniref:Uncharacterized protein n=1 Tax=Arabidopsis suecica TaxID=45249 RepID=A0A8T1XY24_ARASU|nr:hypothetical protein ISN44_As13g000380 [Arabidopsis suecica]